MRHSVSNGNAEALNSKIRLLRIKAGGYRNRERFKLGGDVPLRKAEYGVLSLPTMIGEDPCIYSIKNQFYSSTHCLLCCNYSLPSGSWFILLTVCCFTALLIVARLQPSTFLNLAPGSCRSQSACLWRHSETD